MTTDLFAAIEYAEARASTCAELANAPDGPRVVGPTALESRAMEFAFREMVRQLTSIAKRSTESKGVIIDKSEAWWCLYQASIGPDVISLVDGLQIEDEALILERASPNQYRVSIARGGVTTGVTCIGESVTAALRILRLELVREHAREGET